MPMPDRFPGKVHSQARASVRGPCGELCVTEGLAGEEGLPGAAPASQEHPQRADCWPHAQVRVESAVAVGGVLGVGCVVSVAR